QATDARRGLSSSGGGVGLRDERATQIGIADALNGKLSVQEELEDGSVLGTDRAQRTIGPTVAGDPLTNRVEQVVRGSDLAHHAERLEIARIGGAGDLHPPSQIRDALSQGQPAEDALMAAAPDSAHLEASRIIDGRFDSQQTTRFVVHLDPVFIDAMFDASPLGALAQLSPGLAAEAAGQRPAEKPEDIFRAEVFHGVMQQAGIPAGERGVVTEDDIGGVLALSHASVV